MSTSTIGTQFLAWAFTKPYSWYLHGVFFDQLFRTSQAIYFVPFLYVHAFPALSGFYLFQYILFRITGRGRSRRATNYLKALYSLPGFWLIGDMQRRGWSGDSLPMLGWIGDNMSLFIAVLYLALLWVCPVTQGYLQSNVVIIEIMYTVQNAIPFLRWLSALVMVLTMVAYIAMSPMDYRPYRLAALEFVRWGFVTSMGKIGMLNYLWFAKLGWRLYRQDGLWVVGVVALLNGFIAIMAWGDGDYGSFTNGLITKSGAVWKFYVLISPLIFVLFSLQACGALDWVEVLWERFTDEVVYGPELPPPLTLAEVAENARLAASLARQVNSDNLAVNARAEAQASVQRANIIEADEQRRLLISGLRARLAAGITGLRVELPVNPLDEVLRGAAAAGAATATDDRDDGDQPAAAAAAAAAARRAIMRLIVQGYMTRQPVPLELEIRMADAAGDGLPPATYPPAAALAPAPPAGAPVWPDGPDGADGDGASDAASEDIGGASPVSVIGYALPAVPLGPPPALRVRGRRVDVKAALRDDYEWVEPTYGFPIEPLLAANINLEGAVIAVGDGDGDGYERVADYDPDADFDAGDDIDDPVNDDPAEAQADPEAPSLPEDDSEVMSPTFSLQNDRYEEEYLSWTVPPPPPAGAAPDPYAGRIRGQIVPAVGAARMRNGVPWVHDGSVPHHTADADGYHYQTDDSVDSDGLYRPRTPDTIPNEATLTALQTAWTIGHRVRVGQERRNFDLLASRADNEEELNIDIDTYNNCYAVTRCVSSNYEIHARGMAHELREHMDSQYAYDNIEDNYAFPQRRGVPPRPAPTATPHLDPRVGRLHNRNIAVQERAGFSSERRLYELWEHNEYLYAAYSTGRNQHIAARTDERRLRNGYRNELRAQRTARAQPPKDGPQDGPQGDSKDGPPPPPPTALGTPANMPPLLPARIAYDVDFIQTQDSADNSAERLAKSVDSRPPLSPRAAALGADGWWNDSPDDQSLGEDFILLNSHLRDPTDRNRNRSSLSSRRGHRTLAAVIDQPSWRNYAYHQTPAVAPVGYQPPPRWTRRAIYVEEPGVEGLTELRIPGEDGALVDDGFGNFGYPRYRTPPPRSPLQHRSSLQNSSPTQDQRHVATWSQESPQDKYPLENHVSEGVPESSYRAVLASWLPWKVAGFACVDEDYKPLGTNNLTADESAAIVKVKAEKIIFAQKQELEKWNRQRAYERMQNRPKSHREETEFASSQEEGDESVSGESSDGVSECITDFGGFQNPRRPTGPERPNARYGFRRQANIEAPMYRETENLDTENFGSAISKADSPATNPNDGWRAWTIPEIMGEYFDMTIAAVGRMKPKKVEPMTEDEKEQAKVDTIIESYMKAAEEHRKNPGKPIKKLNKGPTTEQWIRNALYSPKLPSEARGDSLDFKPPTKTSLNHPGKSHAMFSGHPPLNYTAAMKKANQPGQLGFDTWTAEINRRQRETDTWRRRWLVYVILILLFTTMIPLWQHITHVRDEGIQEWYSRLEEESVELKQPIARFVHKWEEDVRESYVQWYDGSEEKALADP